METFLWAVFAAFGYLLWDARDEIKRTRHDIARLSAQLDARLPNRGFEDSE